MYWEPTKLTIPMYVFTGAGDKFLEKIRASIQKFSLDAR